MRHSNTAMGFPRCLARCTNIWWCHRGYFSLFSNGLRLVCTVHSSIRFGSMCSLSLQVCNFTISCNMSVFPLYIEGVINVVKLLGEASLVVINAINLYEYVPFNFHKCRQLVPFCRNRHFSLF
jgi:hypothetical protein